MYSVHTPNITVLMRATTADKLIHTLTGRILWRRTGLFSMRWPLAALAVLLVAIAGCTGTPPEDGSESPTTTGTDGQGELMEMKLTSDAFEEGEPIPETYSCEGQGVSPPLSWSGVPEEARSLVLVMDDPDAPSGTFDHWVLYGIPPGTTGLGEGESAGTAGVNSRGENGYAGPCPPQGTTHTYRFRLYALDTALELGPGASKDDVMGAMEGHVLTDTELTGEFGR